MNEINKQNDVKVEFLDILKNKRTAQKLLKYLSTEEVHRLMICNRRTYFAFVDPKTYIYNKYMFKKYKDNYLFFYHNNNKIKKLNQLLEVINYSDTVYSDVYKKTDTMVIIFYFAGCILILDVFVLFVMLDNSVTHFNDYLPQIPLLAFWVLCIFNLILIFILEQIGINKIKKYFRKNKIVYEDSLIEKKILSNISRRLRHKRPVSYRPICYTYILCYLPIIYKAFFSLTYQSAFLYISSIFCSIGLILDFALFIYYKYKHNKSKIEVYRSIYMNTPNYSYYYYKMLNILSYSSKKPISEIRMGFQYYFFLLFFHGCIIFYAFLIGRKLDDSSFDLSWRILLIPLYIICFIIVLWGIIYIYSIKTNNSEYKIVLITTIIIIIICTITNCVFWPNFYLSNKGITRYFPIVIDGIITITTMIHFFFLSRSKKEDSAKEIQKN